MEENDLLELLDSDEKPFKEEEKSSNKGNFKTQRVSLWDKLDFKPCKLELDKMAKSGKSYSWYVYLTEQSIPDEVVNKIEALAKALGKKDFVFRTIADKTDKVGNKILALEDCKKEIYLPWAKFNESYPEPVLKYPTQTVYEICKAYMKGFEKCPAAVRAINSAYAHTMVGKDGNNQIDFLICYTEGGAEGFGKGFDFKKEGRLGYFISMCNELNIPIFNLKKEESFKRLVKILS